MVKFNRARRSLPRALAARAEQADSHDPVLFSESGMGRDRATSLRRPRHSQTSWSRLSAGSDLTFTTVRVLASQDALSPEHLSAAISAMYTAIYLLSTPENTLERANSGCR